MDNGESRRRRLRPLFALCFLGFAWPFGAQTPTAPPPVAGPDLSTIVVPIHASLAPLLPVIETQLPKTFETAGRYEIDPSGRFAFKYRVLRDPIALNMQGRGLHVTDHIRYALEGCPRARNPINGSFYIGPCVSCGFGEAMREAEFAIHSVVEWNADWTLRSRTTVRPVEFINRCKVTFARVDITDWKLAPLINQQLQQAVRLIDQQIPRVARLRPEAEQIWISLQTPREIAPRTWLVLEPSDVALAPLRGNGMEVETALQMHARTHVVVGEKPTWSLRPLPDLSTAAPASGSISVPFDIDVEYAEASRLVTAQFGGHTYALAGGATLRVGSVTMSPAANGKLHLDADIEYRGGMLERYSGTVALEGEPRLDPSTNTITAAGLDYTIASHRLNPFTRLANRLAHQSVRAELQKNAHWSVAGDIAAAKANIERGLTRSLAPGVQLRARVDSIQPLAVLAKPDALSLHVVATGTATVDVK